MKKFQKQSLQDMKHYAKGLILAFLFLLFFNMVFGQLCMGKILFGIPCPACGITRAFFLLLQGKLKDSFFMHPLLIPLLVSFLLLLTRKYFLKKPLRYLRFTLIIWITLFFIVYFIRLYFYFPETEPLVYYKKNMFSILLQIVKMNISNISLLN